MRYDILIIWGNGLNYVPEIVNEIAIDSNFQIVRLKYHSFTNTKSFIEDVYKCDTVPLEHLISKSKYLHTAPQKCMVIIVKNFRPQEQMVGSGEFKHIQCQNITNLKIRIRSKYNPKFLDVNKQINPLPKGVSHDHVIHGTDYSSQTDYLLKYFNLNTTSYYSRYDQLDYFVPWHLNIETSKIQECTIDISKLKCNILGKGLMDINCSPHYKYVCGKKQEYQLYIEKHIGLELQENHFCKSFDQLIDTYDINYKDYNKKKSPIIINSKNVVVDGLHRVSIMLNLGLRSTKCIQI